MVFVIEDCKLPHRCRIIPPQDHPVSKKGRAAMKYACARLRLCALIAGITIPFAGFPQGYPTKPIRVVSQFASGSSGDYLNRLVSAKLSELIGQPVVVENNAGAGGSVATTAVARAAADGYTLLNASTGAIIIRPALGARLGYDPIKDLAPITMLGESPTAILVPPSFAVNSLTELIAYAKANPGKVLYGTTGVASQSHLAAEELQQLAGVTMTHVPYKAGAQALLDMTAGRLNAVITILTPLVPQAKAGKLKALAVLGKRTNLMPDVPSVSESVPGFETPPSWQGYWAPAGTPQSALQRLQGEIAKSMNSPETRTKILETGTEIVAPTSAEMAAMIQRQTELVARIAKAANIKELQ
ncbi:MAG: tripartite tricarboxylate transporter substrate binding protein [Burkholderiales bacterium]|nr:tripartite tricarboxylate transporter substrate binding protein [Burkholderiales bacterium]